MSCQVCGSHRSSQSHAGYLMCDDCGFKPQWHNAESYRQEKFCPSGERHYFSNFDDRGRGKCTKCGAYNR
jgi:hypothetical protein